jgi:hypothetical protein
MDNKLEALREVREALEECERAERQQYNGDAGYQGYLLSVRQFGNCWKKIALLLSAGKMSHREAVGLAFKATNVEPRFLDESVTMALQDAHLFGYLAGAAKVAELEDEIKALKLKLALTDMTLEEHHD